MTQQFERFCQSVNKTKKIKPFEGRLLAFDPGETTGWSFFQANADQSIRMTHCGQEKTWPQSDMVKGITKLIDTYEPTAIVYELYAVYEWKAESHSWSQVPTLHIIGCIETLCIQRGIPFYTQTAQIAKNFCTDKHLELWGLYQKGQKHARDSIRHGTFFLLFGQTNKN